MRIGIVSKPEHCRAHTEALTMDGHEVKVLGGNPGIVWPENLDVIVLRIASCSHSASDATYAQVRKFKTPLIVQDGLSAIRRELEALKTKNAPAVQAPAPVVVQMTDDQLLLHTVRELDKGPGNAIVLDSRVKGILARFAAKPLEIVPCVMRMIRANKEPLPRLGAFEVMAKVYLDAEFNPKYASAVYTAAKHAHDLVDMCEKLAAAFRAHDEDPTKKFYAQPNVLAMMQARFSGNPMAFSAFHAMILPEGVSVRQRTFVNAYQELTGRNLGPENRDLLINMGFNLAPRWLVQTPPPEAPKEISLAPTSAPALTAPEANAPSDLEHRVANALESAQNEVLDAMVRLETLEKVIKGVESADLAGRVAAIEIVQERFKLIGERVVAVEERIRTDLEPKTKQKLAGLDSSVGMLEAASVTITNKVKTLEAGIEFQAETIHALDRELKDRGMLLMTMNETVKELAAAVLKLQANQNPIQDQTGFEGSIRDLESRLERRIADIIPVVMQGLGPQSGPAPVTDLTSVLEGLAKIGAGITITLPAKG